MSKIDYLAREEDIQIVEYVKVLKKIGKGLQPYFEVHLDNGKIREFYLNLLTPEQIVKFEKFIEKN